MSKMRANARAIGLPGSWTSHSFDPQGSVAQRLNCSQAITSSSYYDEYGQEYTTGAPSDPFGYNAQSGYYVDRQTGKYLLGHRYYDWSAGRFLTRDPIGPAGGINLYGYCQDGPVGLADPDGSVKILVISYRVFGAGWHRGIVVLDNMDGCGACSFAGGPENDGFPHNGALVSRSGAWARGSQDFNKWHSQGDGPMPDDERRVISLVNDNSRTYWAWIRKLRGIETGIASRPHQDYAPLPSDSNLWGGGSANSNTWCHYLIDQAGLSGAYNHAIAKLPGGDLPWAPGWNIKYPWNNQATGGK